VTDSRSETIRNFILAGISALCLIISFPPVDAGGLAFVALIPWLLIIARGSARGVLFYSFSIGAAFFLISVSWLRFVTYAAWISLSLYLACFFAVFGICTRYLYRKYDLPLTLVAPVVWTALEYFRSFFLTGFPWFYLAHTQYANLKLIQIADTTGAYGVTFIIVSVNACAADLFISVLERRRMGRSIAIACWAVGLVLISLLYGGFRLSEYKPRKGPVICLVQGDIPQDLKMEATFENCIRILRHYEKASLLARGREKDIVVWPETMVPGFINFCFIKDKERYYDELIRIADESLRTIKRLGRELSAPLLLGVQFAEKDAEGNWQRFNSAVLFDVDYFEKEGKFLQRYDKIHLVPFGEYTPLKSILPFLARLVPYDVGFMHGKELSVFELKGYKFGVLICYEDTDPALVRRFKREKGVDFMVNISNDGWFRGSAELEEHLYIAVFRAVENRIGLARAANTGITSFISPTGKIEKMITVNGKHKNVTGVLIDRVSLDDRQTFYTAHGDIAGKACLWSVVLSLALSALLTLRTFSPMVRMLRRYAFGIVVEVLFETVCFFIGEIIIYVVSFGRLRTRIQRRNQTPRRILLTSLLGLAVLVCFAVAIAVITLQ